MQGSWLFNITFLLSLGPYPRSWLRDCFLLDQMAPKSCAVLGICLKGSSLTLNSATFTDQVWICVRKLRPHLYFIYIWDFHSLRLSPCLPLMVYPHQQGWHLALCIQLLTKHPRLRNSWILTPTPIKHDFENPLDIQYWFTGYSHSRASPASGPGLLSQNWFPLFPTVSEFIEYLLTKLTPVMTAGPYKTQRMMMHCVTTTQRERGQLPGHMVQ